MNVRISRRAVRDVNRIAEYLGTRNPDAAIEFEADLQDVVALLSAFPQTGRSMERNLRRLMMGRFPYLIFYRILADKQIVNIVTIRHAARRPEAGSR